ncbi:MerR family DNA-binding transcriptional regulator [Alkalihalobacillus sp. 1P02AB]|uniref:MerR family DNA-binding transcriptional regulator n=1 Tax=Alkalihalobacillus sp. 1P02AB TaxID=3132260 RepID=UPI0039A782F3
MKKFKPIEIARELNISTSALRHYEAWGLVPAPDRAENGYRLYTSVHLAYFKCIRIMFFGFGTSITSSVLKHIQKGHVDEAFWILNQEQANLHKEREAANQTLALVENLQLPVMENKKKKKNLTIGEAAEFTGVTTSAIRHWEKEGLLHPKRNPENGYRLFSGLDLRKILLIRSLHHSVYFLKNMKEIIDAMDHQNLAQVKKVTREAVQTIDSINRQQFLGIHSLVELCQELELI